MNSIIEKLAYKIGEGLQASSLSLSKKNLNVFHRNVVTHESSDLSFINGLVSTGLRGSALLSGDKLVGNYNQLLTASRQHLPLVIHTNARLVGESKYSFINNYNHIQAIRQSGSFILIATSAQEEMYLTLIAHRIAELSLIPGIVVADYKASSDEVNFPEDEVIIKFLGYPDDQIECPTPAQEIIFGKHRRRIPNWFSSELPVMLGAKKDDRALSYEGAANRKFFHNHLPELIDQAFEEFNTIAGTNLNSVQRTGQSSRFAIISIGSQVSDLYQQSSSDAQKVEQIQINQLYPFPYDKVVDILKGKKSVTILENTTATGITHSQFYSDVLHSIEGDKTRLYCAKYNSALDVVSLEMAIKHMTSDQPNLEYFLGVPFTNPSSQYPKHNILLQEIEKKYPDISSASISTNRKDENNSPTIQDEIPLAIRMYKDSGPKYSHLTRFYDDTAFFYEHKKYNELIADPFAAIPVTPGASASFFSQSTKRALLPVFTPQNCTGCGDCFVHCPHSALPPISIGIEKLIKAGVKLASAKGKVITKLTPMIKNIAKVADNVINETEVNNVGDFLPAAFESLATQMKLEGEKLELVQSEFKAVMNEVAQFPVAITDKFYNTPSLIEKGTGEMFSLSVDPTACTGCSICAEVCAEDALNMEPQKEATLTHVKDQFHLWEQLPDTDGHTINRLLHDNDYPSLAAILLSRNYYMTMTGASESALDHPYKALLHIVTACTESVVQPKIITQIKNIDELTEALSQNVHNKLSEALPDHNLESLSKSLKKTQRRKIHIQDLVNQMDKDEQGKFVDSEELQRKTDLIQDLKNLKWVLSEGPTATGRSRYGLLLSGSKSLEWAKKYPSNNFSSPCVIHWNGSAPEQSLGLFYGQLRYLLDHFKLLQRAQLEVKDKYDPSIHNLPIAELTWDQLNDHEKQLVPPILLVAERDDMSESGWNSLNQLLVEKYPVKVFLLDHGTSPDQSPEVNLAKTYAGLISAIALKSAFVFQGGMGNVNHLFDGLMDGISKTYPAVFNLFSTNYKKHNESIIDWSPYASLALNSRTFPCLSFDPGKQQGFLRGAVNLTGNRNIKEDWVKEEVTVSTEKNISYEISWADWAFTQPAWKSHFTKVEKDNSQLLVTDFIRSDYKTRKGKVPVITRSGKSDLIYYSVSKKILRMTETVLSHWNTLQELAGVISEFPLKLKEEVAKELKFKYEQEVEALRKEYEQKLKDKEAEQTEVLRQRLKEKLLALSNLTKNKIKV